MHSANENCCPRARSTPLGLHVGPLETRLIVTSHIIVSVEWDVQRFGWEEIQPGPDMLLALCTLHSARYTLHYAMPSSL